MDISPGSRDTTTDTDRGASGRGLRAGCLLALVMWISMAIISAVLWLMATLVRMVD